MDDSITTSPGGSVASHPTAPSYPLVTVAMVAHNPGAWFTEVLRSIAAQDYPNLDLVVIDAASDIAVAPRVHEVIPEATVVPLVANQGFAKNANVILDHEELGPYVLVCHDDVALAPDCIRRLIEEALRSNAGIVGPKLVVWNDPERILHVGFGADKTGLVTDLAEPGEVDQEQHDAVRDVFAVPGAATLIRTDLFQALQGFDEAMLVRGEDLDLCWRAHACGARVMVNPAATARHREDLPTRVIGTDSDQIARRHRLRSLLSNYGFWHTVRVVPQAMAASLVNIVLAIVQGRMGLVLEIVSAWTWNLARLPSIMRRRRALARVRQVDDAEVRALQIPGFEGLQSWRRARADQREQDAAEVDEYGVERVRAERSRDLQLTLAVWVGVIAVVVFGSRELISGGVPVFNEFTGFPDGPSSLLAEWNSTWRSVGVGAQAPASMLHLVLGFGGIVLFGQMGLLRLLVTVGLIGVGVFGAWRLTGPFRSLQAQLVAVVLYTASPIPYNALWGGQWSALVAYAALPWIAKRLAVAAAIPPYGDRDDPLHRRVADVAVAALMTATAALVQPVLVVVPVVLAALWLVGSLATRRVRGALRLVAVALGSTGLAIALLFPSSLVWFEAGLDWSTIAGTAPRGGEGVGLSRALRLATGPHGNSALGWAQLVVPAIALAVASGQRLAWAARSWFVAIASIATVVAIEQDAFDFAMPTPTLLLAPAGLSLAMAGAMAAVAFSNDLRRYRFGWRQLVPFVALAAFVLSAAGGVGAAFGGRWQVVEDGHDDVLDFFDTTAPAHARAVWIGEAEVLPVDGWRYDDRLTWALTHARTPTVLDHGYADHDPVLDEVRRALASTFDGSANRLGRRLAGYGVRYVIVVESNAPEPFGTIDRPVPDVLQNRLSEQLDLIRVEVRSGVTIYENRAWVPIVSAFGADTLGPGSLDGQRFELALPEVTSLRTYRGSVPASDLHLAVPAASRWTLDVDGAVISSTARDWSTAFRAVPAGQQATLTYTNEPGLWMGSIVQLVVWIGLIGLLVLTRRRP